MPILALELGELPLGADDKPECLKVDHEVQTVAGFGVMVDASTQTEVPEPLHVLMDSDLKESQKRYLESGYKELEKLTHETYSLRCLSWKLGKGALSLFWHPIQSWFKFIMMWQSFPQSFLTEKTDYPKLQGQKLNELMDENSTLRYRLAKKNTNGEQKRHP